MKKLAKRRMVFVWTDMSTIGGVPNRIRKTLAAAQNRKYNFIGLSFKNANETKVPNVLCYGEDPEQVQREIASWTPEDTVLVLANSVSRVFPKHVIRLLHKLPIIYMCSGQLAFFIQHSRVLLDSKFVDDLRASRIISFSDADICFQRQLGIHGQIKGYVPVNIRSKNTYDPKRNRHVGYVGRIDYNTKDCIRLLDVAQALRAAGLPPLRIYTTNGLNSPNYSDFIQKIEEQGLADAIEIITNETDQEVIYRDISMLVLPSKLESFGNVVLEAFSFGIPVISTTYAPGPAETITHGKSGFLLDNFIGAHVVDLVKGQSARKLQALSRNAFAAHKKYSMSSYLEFMENVADGVLKEFKGENQYPVLPRLLITEKMLETNFLPKAVTRQLKSVNLPKPMAVRKKSKAKRGVMAKAWKLAKRVLKGRKSNT